MAAAIRHGIFRALSLEILQEIPGVLHMSPKLVLASGSEIRQTVLRNAGVPFETRPSRVDEVLLRASMQAEGAPPRDIADKLAEMKALRAPTRSETELVLGCDQVLAYKGDILGKPETAMQAREQLCMLRNETHQLISAAVICEDGKPVWRHAATARMRMRDFSDAYLDAYLARNWPSVRHSVGGYKLEEEGVRLFSAINGDYFCILGLPLLELLAYLGQRGVIET